MRLDTYRRGNYTPGASLFRQLAWHFIGRPVVLSSLLPFSSLKVGVLRLFGARIGEGVRIKPGVRVKFPWRLSVGSHSWIGEDVWIDNLAQVSIGSHCCVSQGVYLCTGSHNWATADFGLVTNGITVRDQVWLAARASVSPGVTMAEGTVLTLGSVLASSTEPWMIYSGVPAVAKKARPRN